MGIPGNKHSLSKSTHFLLIAFKPMIKFGLGLEFSENQNQQKKHIKHCVCVCRLKEKKRSILKKLIWMIVRSANLEIYTVGQPSCKFMKVFNMSPKPAEEQTRNSGGDFYVCSLERISFVSRKLCLHS